MLADPNKIPSSVRINFFEKRHCRTLPKTEEMTKELFGNLLKQN
jgi:hypothetical protein